MKTEPPPVKLELCQMDGYYSTIMADGVPLRFATDTTFATELVRRYNAHADFVAALRDAADFLSPRSAMADLRRGSDASHLHHKLKTLLADLEP